MKKLSSILFIVLCSGSFFLTSEAVQNTAFDLDEISSSKDFEKYEKIYTLLQSIEKNEECLSEVTVELVNKIDQDKDLKFVIELMIKDYVLLEICSSLAEYNGSQEQCKTQFHEDIYPFRLPSRPKDAEKLEEYNDYLSKLIDQRKAIIEIGNQKI